LDKVNADNRQVQRTRGWLLEALLVLLDEKPYEKIGVSDITKKAGVARQTFYRNYDTKDDIVIQYLDDIFKSHLMRIRNTPKPDKSGMGIVILRFEQIIEHKEKLTRLFKGDTEHLFYSYFQKWEDAILDLYKDKLTEKEYLLYRYMIKFQLGGSLRLIIDWFKNDMPLSSGKMAELLIEFQKPFEMRDTNISKILEVISQNEKIVSEFSGKPKAPQVSA
jgi:AcrR family transcriptional regulator